MSLAADTSLVSGQGRGPASGSSSARIDWSAFGVRAAILGLLVVVLYWRVIYLIGHKWWNVGDWSHGWLIPLFSLYYLYMQLHRAPVGQSRPGYLGLLVLLASFGLYLLGIFAKIDYCKGMSLLLTIFSVVFIVGGWAVARWSWFAVAFLFFGLPLPQQLYEQITMPLQQIASHVSTILLNLLPGMEAEAERIVVSYHYKGTEGELNVEQACSGIRLLMAFVALGVAMAFVSERPLWHRMVMIVSCIPIAIFCNVVRVTTTGLCVVMGRNDLARGTYHEMLGLGMIAIAFALYGLLSYVLENLFVDVGEEPAVARERDT